MKTLSAKEATQWSGRVIDVRNYDEFLHERLTNAQCVPLDRLTAAAGAWNPEEQLLIMCKSGIRSRKAAEQLEVLGFKNVWVLEGGIEACKQAGVQIVRERKTIPIIRQVMIAAGSLVLAGVLLAQIHPAWIILSGLVGAGMIFAGVTGICCMAMLLERMPWNRVDRATGDRSCCSGGCPA